MLFHEIPVKIMFLRHFVSQTVTNDAVFDENCVHWVPSFETKMIFETFVKSSGTSQILKKLGERKRVSRSYD